MTAFPTVMITVEAQDVRVTLPVPADWLITTPNEDVIRLVAAEPVEADSYASTIVLTVEQLQAGTGLRTWQQQVDLTLSTILCDYLLIDIEHCEVAGHPGVRRLSHHVTPEQHAVSLEQWSTIVGTAGLTVTVSIHTLLSADVGTALAALVHHTHAEIISEL